MRVDVHILSHDEEQFLEWSLRHYTQEFKAAVYVHDGGPTFRNRELCLSYGASFVEWDTAGELNDELAMKLKNDCWKGTAADWVIVVDADEILYFPAGARATLFAYEERRAIIPRPHGFEMFSEEWFDAVTFPATTQITELVKDGAPEDKWYSKPVLFSPKRVREIGYGIGAHETRTVLKTGSVVNVNPRWPKANPEGWLLHFKAIGPIERVAERYDATRKRLSSVNVRQGWGNVRDTGMEHALYKRGLIMPTLRRVIP